MATFKRGSSWYHEFVFHGRRHRRSAAPGSTQAQAKALEAAHRLRLVQTKAARKHGGHADEVAKLARAEKVAVSR